MKIEIDMKKIVFSLALFAASFAFFSCADTTDCLCTYDNGQTTTVADYDGDCSAINIDELLSKKALPGTSATAVSCTES